MNEINICYKEHFETSPVMHRVPFGQGGTGRHKCAACAYEKGLEHGLSLSPESNFNLDVYLANLPESQRGTWRHRNPKKAYKLGYLQGTNRQNVQNGICKKTHREASEVMSAVKGYQGGIGRHKCAACAYDKGVEHGQFPDPDFVLESFIAELPESQRDTWRHKCPKEAYELGVQHGLNLSFD